MICACLLPVAVEALAWRPAYLCEMNQIIIIIIVVVVDDDGARVNFVIDYIMQDYYKL